MDDISARLTQLLSDEETMGRIKEMASALGMASPGERGGGDDRTPDQDGEASASGSPPTDGLDLGMLLNALGGADRGRPPGEEEDSSQGSREGRKSPGGGEGFPLDPALISMLMEMMGTFRQRNQNEELLLALRPYFHDGRQKKVDEAIRMVKLLRLLPLLRESGILGDLFGGEGEE